ncbi:HoxN/HupN/NixA family nickel/cobalt transporter [Rhizobium sp. 2YAF20]|uniref:HoxN/HupN/NixA family nickel/cobalt transporter n=1 Tax=Rhizobium sp. 2YAF20 TaxID=3233027 RepID=UPI003F9DFD60
MLSNPFDDKPSQVKTKVATTYAFLIAANIAAWVWAWVAFTERPVLLGTAFLAYIFGLRHAFDADHIAAIDNVVRKLMQEGKSPYSVGFFFSFGHSSIVVLASIAIAATAAAMQSRLDEFHDIGGVIGTTATEIGLLGISATQAAQGMSFWVILVFPALFTAGMSLMDTTDSVLMTGAYGWAFVNPIRKLWYNLTITAASVAVAVFIGGLEALGLIADKLGHRLAVEWIGSNFAIPTAMPPGPYLLALRGPNTSLSPRWGPAWTISNPEAGHFALMQAPCSSAFLFPAASYDADRVRQALKDKTEK